MGGSADAIHNIIISSAYQTILSVWRDQLIPLRLLNILKCANEQNYIKVVENRKVGYILILALLETYSACQT